ncbi:MAG: chemotaxis protein CheX [Desulfobulbaceae bacterium]|nr:chemotaxis protein CheX [Desulfobulbaceae bacterium]
MIGEIEKTQLNAAAVEVFGMMYYTPVELLPELPTQESSSERQYIKTAIEYTGSNRASICFYFPRTLAVNIAGGFLGIDEDQISDSQLIDTMREAANMIIGNFLGRIDPDGGCTLGIPQAEVTQGFSPDRARQGDELLAFISDFGHLWMIYNENGSGQN